MQHLFSSKTIEEIFFCIYSLTPVLSEVNEKQPMYREHEQALACVCPAAGSSQQFTFLEPHTEAGIPSPSHICMSWLEPEPSHHPQLVAGQQPCHSSESSNQICFFFFYLFVFCEITGSNAFKDHLHLQKDVPRVLFGCFVCFCLF